ncbi:MAG: ParB/RepB/Spo0J family partition protein [Clostridiales bacterium]|nr:ParB/RepB/Spo0J family partition protein [Clostridiales bacterium]
MENIPIDMIKPNPYQPRKNISIKGLEELAQSIKQYGVIQPITVRRSSSGGYELIAGERRLRAAKMAGLDYICSIIIDTYEQDSAILAMIENLQRENLHFLEEAEGYASLIEDHGFTQEELAVKLGKNQSTIANKLRILRLSREIKEILIKAKLSERHARALLKLPDEKLQMQAVQEVIRNQLNVRDTEAVIDNLIERIRDGFLNSDGTLIKTDEGDRYFEKGRKKKRQRRIFTRTKDYRIFINTINHAINILKKYGLEVHYEQIDKDEFIEFKIAIQKN